MSANQGRVRSEGVVGLARAFLFAGAAATVVSLWDVHDGSTAALMEQMYTHLEDGLTTVAQALRLVMLHLLRGESSRKWKRPLYWAAFLVVGANTRLPGVDTLEDRAEKEPSGTVPRERKKPSGPLTPSEI